RVEQLPIGHTGQHADARAKFDDRQIQREMAKEQASLWLLIYSLPERSLVLGCNIRVIQANRYATDPRFIAHPFHDFAFPNMVCIPVLSHRVYELAEHPGQKWPDAIFTQKSCSF